MKINRKNALHLWEEHYGTSLWATDFDGGLMYKEAYGDDEVLALSNGFQHIIYQKGNMVNIWGSPPIYCGWNIHHILPKANGGTNEKSNLICTNIITNEEAENKTTFWIEHCHYQVQRISGTSQHEIVWLNEPKTRIDLSSLSSYFART